MSDYFFLDCFTISSSQLELSPLDSRPDPVASSERHGRIGSDSLEKWISFPC